ncbi:MAG TPA: pilus assembly protein CpaE [Anaerolineae bacterium]
MISLALAQELKEAGLVWKAGIHDFFAIPDRDLDDRVFVVTDVMAYLEIFRGWPVVTFHGAAEWALDYILTTEVVWMPTEGQLRQELEHILMGEEKLKLQLFLEQEEYTCEIYYQGQDRRFTAPTADEAYVFALLHALRHYPQP